MNINDIKLICIKNIDSDTWTVYPDKLKGIVVQVDNLRDAPREISKSLEVFLEYGFDSGIHEIKEFDISTLDE